MCVWVKRRGIRRREIEALVVWKHALRLHKCQLFLSPKKKKTKKKTHFLAGPTFVQCQRGNLKGWWWSWIVGNYPIILKSEQAKKYVSWFHSHVMSGRDVESIFINSPSEYSLSRYISEYNMVVVYTRPSMYPNRDEIFRVLFET